MKKKMFFISFQQAASKHISFNPLFHLGKPRRQALRINLNEWLLYLAFGAEIRGWISTFKTALCLENTAKIVFFEKNNVHSINATKYKQAFSKWLFFLLQKKHILKTRKIKFLN